MKINYEVTGSDRKQLVKAISEITGTKSKYLGAPSFSYQIGDYTIDKNGAVAGPDNRNLEELLNAMTGFEAAEKEYDEPDTYKSGDGETPAFEALKMSEREELGLGKERRENYQGENGMQPDDYIDPTEQDQLVIELPRDSFTDANLENLKRLIESKETLIKNALGVDGLPLEVTKERVSFPWFAFPVSPEEIKAYSAFITALARLAKEQKRVTAKPKEIDNEKYAFRCFLLRLGFIGDEYKAERKILLSKLTGSSAFKNGEAKDKEVE